MNQPFEKNLKAAVGPGWCIWLIAVVGMTAHWFTYRHFMTTKPDWILEMMGPDMTWAESQKLWLLILVLGRMFIGAFLLLMLWLTLWSRKLNR